MASAYGIIHNYGEPKSLIDDSLDMQALQYKQEKYDANSMRIQKAVAKMGVDINTLKRDKDKKYLYNKVNNLINGINNLQNADLSSNKTTMAISGHVKEAVDPYITTQLGISKQYDSYVQQAQQVKEDDPEKYSQKNFQAGLALSGWGKYMSGDSDNVNTSQLQYTPFKDYNNDIIEKIGNLKKSMTKRVIQVPDGKGGKVEKTTETLTTAEWMRYMPSLFTQQDRDQMAIDGAAEFGFNDKAAQQWKSRYSSSLMDPLRKKIKDAKRRLKTPKLSDFKKDQIEANINKLENRKAQVSQRINSMGSTAQEIGLAKIEQQTINSISNIVGNDPSIRYSVDKAYYKKKDEAEALDPNSASNFKFSSTPDLSEDQRELNTEDFRQERTTVNSTYHAGVRGMYEKGLSEETKEEVDEEIDSLREDPEYSDYSEEDLKYEAIDRYFDEERDDIGLYDSMKDTRTKRDQYTKAVGKTFKQVAEDYWKGDNLSKIYNATFNERNNVKIDGQDQKEYFKNVEFIDSDGKHHTGVQTQEEFKKYLDSEKGSQFKQNLYADYLLNNQLNDGLGNRGTLGSALSADTDYGNKIPRIGKSTINYVRRYLDSTGNKNMGITDLITFTSSGMQTNVEDAAPLALKMDRQNLTEKQVLNLSKEAFENVHVSLNPAAKGTRAYELLQNKIKNGQITNKKYYTGEQTNYNPISRAITAIGSLDNIRGFDRTFYDDSDMRDIFSYEKSKEKFNEKLNENSINIGGRSKVSIKTPLTKKDAKEDPIFRQTQVLVSENAIEGGFSLKANGQPYSITRGKGANRDTFVISQLQEDSKADYEEGDFKKAVGQRQARVTVKSVMDSAPALMSNLQDQYKEGELVYSQNSSLKNDNIGYVKNNATSKKKLIDYMGPEFATMAIDEEANNYIERRHPELYQGNLKRVGNFIKTAMSRPDMFSVNYKRRGETGVMDVNVKVGGTKEEPKYKNLNSIDLTGYSNKQVKMLYNVAPQVFVTMAMNSAANEIEQDGDESNAAKILNQGINATEQ